MNKWDNEALAEAGYDKPMKRKNSIIMRALEVLRSEGVLVFYRKALAYIQELLILPYALWEIKKFQQSSLDDLVDFCFYGVARLIKPLQFKNEVLRLITMVNEIKPQTVIEIGTAGGGTLFLFCRVASKDATIISIDLPGGRFGGGYPCWKIPLYKRFRLPKQELHLERADSHSQETLDKVNNILGNRKVDFLFIDGDHSYYGVRMDFEMFSPLVKDGGIIAFHDIVVHPTQIGCDVNKLWDEIKESKKYDYTEVVSDWNQGMCGIGILQRRKKL